MVQVEASASHLRNNWQTSLQEADKFSVAQKERRYTHPNRRNMSEEEGAYWIHSSLAVNTWSYIRTNTPQASA